jgi:hypothetical protein
MARGVSLRQYNGAESTVPSLVMTQRFIYVREGSVVEVSRIRSILVNKQNNFKKRNAARNSPRFAYSSGQHLFILLYWGGNRNT